MTIDGKTRLLGLIGNPVEHTLSPLIQNGLCESMRISSVYVPFQVQKEGLGEAIKGAYELNILGMNVTVPHKNQVVDYLVDVDEAARQIGAVNTLVRDDSQHGYKGYNTDILGLKRQIYEDGINLRQQTVVILGAGGAAKAVTYLCLEEGAKKVYLLNRTIEKAEAIADCMNQCFADKQETTGSVVDSFTSDSDKKESQIPRVVPMALADYEKIKENHLIVFQATSIGLAPNVEDVIIDDPIFYQKVKIGVDLIYNPADTKFMQLVKEYGGKAYNALKMLLYQGVTAFELWHDCNVDEKIVANLYTELKRKVYPKDNLVLIGFMGSGKTTIGKELAKRLHMDFLDTDDYIEKQAGKSIASIFAEEGEEAFRLMETEALGKLRDTLSNTVLSTGGGMPLRAENAGLLKEIGTVYYLTAAEQVLYDRLKGNSDRPLLQEADPYKKICELMKQRKPLYLAAADILIDTNSNDMEEVIEDIMREQQRGMM